MQTPETAKAIIETISAAPPDSPLLDSPAPALLPALSDEHKRFLDFYFAHGENPAAVAAQCNTSLCDIIAWLTRPEISAYIRAYRTMRIQRQRDDALAELQHITNSAHDPVERRRAAGTLLRATDPTRWARLRRATAKWSRLHQQTHAALQHPPAQSETSGLSGPGHPSRQDPAAGPDPHPLSSARAQLDRHDAYPRAGDIARMNGSPTAHASSIHARETHVVDTANLSDHPASALEDAPPHDTPSDAPSTAPSETGSKSAASELPLDQPDADDHTLRPDQTASTPHQDPKPPD